MHDVHNPRASVSTLVAYKAPKIHPDGMHEAYVSELLDMCSMAGCCSPSETSGEEVHLKTSTRVLSIAQSNRALNTNASSSSDVIFPSVSSRLAGTVPVTAPHGTGTIAQMLQSSSNDLTGPTQAASQRCAHDPETSQEGVEIAPAPPVRKREGPTTDSKHSSLLGCSATMTGPQPAMEAQGGACIETEEAMRSNTGLISRADSVDEVMMPTTVLPSCTQQKDTPTMAEKVKQGTLGGRTGDHIVLGCQAMVTERCVGPSHMPRHAVADCNATALLVRASSGSPALSLSDRQVSGKEASVHVLGKEAELPGAASDSHLQRADTHGEAQRRDEEVAKAQAGGEEEAEGAQTRDEAEPIGQRKWHREEEQQALSLIKTRCLEHDAQADAGTQVRAQDGACMAGNVAVPQLGGEPGASAVDEAAVLDARTSAHEKCADLWAAAGERVQQQHLTPVRKRHVKSVEGKHVAAAAQVDGGLGAYLTSCRLCLHFSA